ncbi:MAG: nicotinate-nucleotide adenylyltransferase [Chloroflexi bacterium]|nr:nicotinate-nucleotide adenylyltransferase [Chloroflexota bacterium]
MSKDVAIFGGTFDPIHVGHLIVAEEVRVKLGVEEIVFVPVGQPWLKTDRRISSGKHRLAMIRLAIADNPHFKVSTLEIDRPGLTYTVDTVDMLRRQMGSEAKLFFLMGGDSLRELPQWKEPKRLIQLCWLVVFSRPDSRLPSMNELEEGVPGVSDNIVIVEVPQIDVSATEVRQQVRQGDPIDELVLPAVKDYILGSGLYREGV